MGAIARFLISRGLLSGRQVVDGELRIDDLTRRNRNFRVRTQDGGGFLLKQPRHFDAPALQSLTAEARMLEAFATDDAMSAFRQYAPEYVFFDARNAVLATRLIHPATSLTKLHLHYGEIAFPVDVAACAGALLARCHAAGERAVARGDVRLVQRHPPPALALVNEQYLVSEGSVGVSFWDIIRDMPNVRNLQTLLDRWKSFEGLVHADARWDNFLLSNSDEEGNLSLRLIDWELSRIGDPMYDVAAFLGDYLRFWLALANVRRVRGREQALKMPPYDRTAHHPSATAFWDTYTGTRGFNEAQRRDAARRIRDYLPYYVQLIAWENAMGQAAAGQDGDVAPAAELAMATARQLADDPRESIKEWIGIDIQ